MSLQLHFTQPCMYSTNVGNSQYPTTEARSSYSAFLLLKVQENDIRDTCQLSEHLALDLRLNMRWYVIILAIIISVKSSEARSYIFGPEISRR